MVIKSIPSAITASSSGRYQGPRALLAFGTIKVAAYHNDHTIQVANGKETRKYLSSAYGVKEKYTEIYYFFGGKAEVIALLFHLLGLSGSKHTAYFWSRMKSIESHKVCYIVLHWRPLH